MRNPIDEHFEKGLESLEIAPRADLWKQKIAPQLAPSNSNKAVWYRAAAIFIVLLSGLFALNYFGKSGQKPAQLLEQPVATKVAPQVLPVVTIAPAVEEIAAAHQPKTAKQKALKKPLKAKTSSAATTVLPEVKNDEKAEQTIAAVTETSVQGKPTYKVKLSINTQKYADAALAQTAASESENVKEYAAGQWENFKNGEKLNAPPKEWFTLPRLAVRVEGNPIKGVLNP